MDRIGVNIGVKDHKKRLKRLISSPDDHITRGRISDVLLSRNALEYELISDCTDNPRYLKAVPSEEALLQELEQLDTQLKQQAPRILAHVDITELCEDYLGSLFKPEFRKLFGWWWYLDSIEIDGNKGDRS